MSERTEVTTDEKLDLVLEKLGRMEALHVKLLVEKPTQKELAKQMGVSRSTLYRRRDREKIQQLLER